MMQPDHSDIYRSIGQLEGTVTGLKEQITDGFEGLHAKIDEVIRDHGERLGKVETFQSEQQGAWKLMTILGAALAAIGGVVGSFWSSLFGS